MKRSILAALVAVLVVVPALSLRADTPLPPPELWTVFSPSKACCAVLDPRTQVTTVFAVDPAGARMKLWAMVGWHRAAFLADDGVHLVLGHPGLNLLPLDVRDDDVLLWFVRRGELVATRTVLEVVGSRSVLRRTASHWLWGGCRGIDGEGRFVVSTADERVVRFDLATGSRVD